jgi:hypothetical protein
VRVVVDLTEAEARSAAFVLLAQRVQRLAVLLACCVVLALLLPGTANLRIATAAILVVALLGVVIWATVSRVTQALRAQGPIEFFFSGDEIFMRTRDVETRARWSVYQRLSKKRGWYLLQRRGSNLVTPIPRRAFESEDDEQRFLQIVEHRLSGTGALLSAPIGLAPFAAQMPAPGWYPDPVDVAIVRWWDGTKWTEAAQPR